ncbi:MAG: protein-glutamate O-methyltransferase CheR [Halobacteriovoraceae bacterium]|nr:protein-glutamate O-methyltransferase CheR [Halobacteriovoraceae bacterium]
MISNEIYKFFAELIYKKSGILYAENDYYRLDARLNTLVKELSLGSVEELHKAFRLGPDQKTLTLLVDLSTNNETYFLRDNKPFRTLTRSLIPEFVEKIPAGNINIWSAGCSTGQEPYSILMSIFSTAKPEVISRITMTATDISTQAIKKGESGTYNGLEVQRGLPIALLMKFFSQNEDESWTINSEIRSKVQFSELNLLTEDFPSEKYHIIFCRNVLIYQDSVNREKIINKLYDALRPEGYLFMGAGESLIGMNVKFKQKKVEESIIFQKVD